MWLLADVDWTAICVASIGLLGTVVTVWGTIVLKRIEARARAAERAAGSAASRAQSAADSVIIPPKKKRKKPPTHPDG